MPAIVISPKNTEVSREFINRFLPTGNMLLLSSDPMGSEIHPDLDCWYRIPDSLEDSVDQEVISMTLSTLVESLARDDTPVDAVFIFPNKSSNQSFLTTSYGALLSAFSSNVVIPLSLVMLVIEFCLPKHPELPVFIFHEHLGYENTTCLAGVSANFAAANKNDKTGQVSRMAVRNVDCSGEDWPERFDQLCEKDFVKYFK